MRMFGNLMIFVLLIAAGCNSYSGEIHERGKVAQVTLLPGGMADGYNFGKGGGYSATYIPDRYVIVIECEDHKFIIKNESAKKLFDSLRVGDVVDVTYQNVLSGDRVVGREFVNATKEPKQ